MAEQQEEMKCELRELVKEVEKEQQKTYRNADEIGRSTRSPGKQ